MIRRSGTRPGLHAGTVAAALTATGLAIRSQIMWVKPSLVLSRGDYHWRHEPCWNAVRTGRASRWRGDRRQSTVWEVPNLNPVGGARGGSSIDCSPTVSCGLRRGHGETLDHYNAGPSIGGG